MSDMLSQAEIDALLSVNNGNGDIGNKNDLLPQEKDALGEIGNISMGTAATTLYNLLGQKVAITTPKVDILDWDNLTDEYNEAHVAVKVEYTNGLEGSNLLVLRVVDTKIITDLMMGGDGTNSADSDLSDLHLSAISEAMNQMVGSASTSLSEMFNKRIDISPPKAFITKFEEEDRVEGYGDEKLVRIMFKIIVGDLINSEIMQLMPITFAKKLVENLINVRDEEETGQEQAPLENSGGNTAGNGQSEPKILENTPIVEDDYDYKGVNRGVKSNINVQPAQFKDFDDDLITVEKKNINLIMDVPLEVTVELGRTKKIIKDILELGPGSIIELDKLAGDPVDILVNGKRIAKGEVVVIDESFGVRITDIVHPSRRL